MICWSTSEFIFMTILLGSPARCASAVDSISAISGFRIQVGATSALRCGSGWPYPVNVLKRLATSSPISGSAVNRPKSSYRRAFLAWKLPVPIIT